MMNLFVSLFIANGWGPQHAAHGLEDLHVWGSIGRLALPTISRGLQEKLKGLVNKGHSYQETPVSLQ